MCLYFPKKFQQYLSMPTGYNNRWHDVWVYLAKYPIAHVHWMGVQCVREHTDTHTHTHTHTHAVTCMHTIITLLYLPTDKV